MYQMSFKEISDAMRKKPVFIIGEARSGTSKLYHVMQGLPEFQSIKLSLSETHLFALQNKSFRFDYQPYSGKLHRYMSNDDYAVNNFLRKIMHIKRFHRIINNINYKEIVTRILYRNYFLRKIWWYSNLNHLVFRSFFYYAQKGRRCKRIIEKSPCHIGYIPEIKWTFPSSILLFVCRHPVDTYSSYRRREQIENVKSGNVGEAMSPEHFCNIYKRHLELFWDGKRMYRESLYLIRYEHLTQKPELTLRKICNYCEANYVPYTKLETDTKHLIPNIKNTNEEPHLFKPLNKKTKDWKDYISIENAKYIEDNLLGTMEKLDYSRYT